MWDLENEETYCRIHSFTLEEAFTYGDTRSGHTDKEKREMIRARAAVSRDFPSQIPQVEWWAFRIFVRKAGNRRFDIENVPKLVIDAFCRRQIETDDSSYTDLALYDDDTIDFVRVIQVGGERTSGQDSMVIEIFGRRP